MPTLDEMRAKFKAPTPEEVDRAKRAQDIHFAMQFFQKQYDAGLIEIVSNKDGVEIQTKTRRGLLRGPFYPTGSVEYAGAMLVQMKGVSLGVPFYKSAGDYYKSSPFLEHPSDPVVVPDYTAAMKLIKSEVRDLDVVATAASSYTSTIIHVSGVTGADSRKRSAP
jgi:hypothetical protein